MPEKTPLQRPPFRQWKRTVAAALLLLVGGAIVNIAVAWGCVVAHGVVATEWAPFHNPADEPPVVHVTVRFGYEQVRGVGRSGTLLDRHAEHVRRYRGRAWWPEEAIEPLVNAYAVAAGWPLLSLSNWRTIRRHDRGEFIESIPTLHWGFAWREDDRQNDVWVTGTAARPFLPLHPLFPGFIINTLFYALLLWLLFIAPFAARRMLRRRRGQCEKCAYPIGTWGSTVCTECGATVPRHEPRVIKRSPSAGDPEHH